jgi:hypothetical protein
MLAVDMDFKIDAFVVFPAFKNMTLGGFTVKVDNIGLPTNYGDLVGEVLTTAKTDFNAAFASGWALANLDPSFGMIGGLLQKFILTPTYMDHFMFTGFSMYADFPTTPAPAVLPIVQ